MIMTYLYARKRKYNCAAVISVSEYSQVLFMLFLFQTGKIIHYSLQMHAEFMVISMSIKWQGTFT